MKKYFLLALFLPLLGAGGVSAQASKVKIESVGANYAAATPTVTFSVSWPAGSRNANEQSKLWVWVDYRPMKNNAAAGSWQRAGITETPTYHSAGTPALEPGNDSGFWLQGSTDNSAFAATLTVRVNVDLSGYDPQFNWCAYASDRPPHAEPIEGGYTLNGTPPFIIQTQRNKSGSTASISSSTYHNCIYGLTDATGAPGVVSPVPEITAFTSSAATLCAGQSATLTATLAAAGSFSYSFDNGATWQTGNTKVVSPATSATYILKAKHADGGCTVTALSPIEITV
ncbi:MAG: hypothetical protein LBU42_05195, partial [Prevotellaceae bacterium]|nr:hypothetical protein [Prevotellaceae bacterium]